MKHFSLRSSSKLFLAIFLGVSFGIFSAAASPLLNSSNSKTAKNTVPKVTAMKSNSDQTIGTLKGNFQVSSQGNATYSIPIAVPPGTADIAPLLSIVYNSQGSNLPASNGLLGTGFSLQGLTAITRCPSTHAKNGHIHGVDYTDQDLYCFNGEQLVAVKGAYGADTTEYRTYIDTRTKIISYGRQGNGPASFKIWTKGGQVAEYAMTQDSQVKAEGKPTVATWALNKIIDAAGNYLTVTYFKDESKGEYYPSRIDYTGNDKAGLKPYNSVRFFYEGRPDPRNWYKAGSKEFLDQRMNEIKVYNGEAVVYDYKFGYGASANTYRSRLSTIQECDGNGICLRPLMFTWQTNEEGWEYAPQFAPPKPIAVTYKDYSADTSAFIDLKGNGLTDFIYSVISDHGVWYSSNSGFYATVGQGHWNIPRDITTDDGKNDGVRFVDLKGDGLPALIYSAIYSTGASNHGVWYNNGTDWYATVGEGHWNMPRDIVNDHKDDGVRFVDLKGDGLPALVYSAVYRNGSDHGVWYNNGTNWYATIGQGHWNMPRPIVTDGYKDGGVRFVDLRGSGLPDLVYSKIGEKDPYGVWFNTGANWYGRVNEGYWVVPKAIATADGFDNGVRFADVEGTGLSALLFNNGHDRGAWLNKAKKLPDYLIGITDGYGGQLKIDYESLSNPKVNVYTKEHDAKYPNMDWQGPMYVVYQTASDMGVTDNKIKEQVLSKNVKNSFGDNPLLHVTTYHYTGAKMNHLGYGFLGFHQVTTKDETTGINVTTTYSQDYNQHILGQVLNSETRLANGALIASTQNTWDLKTFGSGINTYFVPYTKNIVNKTFDFNGNLISTKITDVTADDYTNPTQIVSSIQDATGTYTTTTQNTYQNNADKWIIGELHDTKVTNSAPNKPSITRHSVFGYDDNGLLVSATVEPDDARYKVTTTYGRNNFGNIEKTLISAKGVADRSSGVTYDPTQRFAVQNVDALNHSTYQTYDERFSKVATAKDHNGLTVTNHYDNFGRLIQTDYPDGTQQLTDYNWCDGPNNAVYKVTARKSGSPAHVEYFDQANRKVAETTEGFSGKIIWTMTYYDDLGRVVQKTLPYFAGDAVYSVRFEYDDLGRVKKTIHPDGTATQVEYRGLTTVTTNAKGQKQTKIANARDNLIQVIDNLGKNTFYDYDAYSNLIKVTDSAGNISSIKYDDYGHKIEMNDPDKGKWTYEYDPLGQLISQTDAMGQKTSFEYDLLGRMVKRTDPAGTSTWEYGVVSPSVDKLVKVTGVANASGGTASGNDLVRAAEENLINYERIYVYDKPLGRLAQTTTNVNGQSYIARTSYDGLSRPDTEVYPNAGLIVKDIYNSRGYLVEIDNLVTGQMYWRLNEMDAANHVISETDNNGLITNYTYDAKTGFLSDIVTSLNPSLEVQKRIFPLQTAIPVKSGQDHAKKIVNKINNLQNQGLKNTQEIQNLHYSYDEIGNMNERKDKINGVTEDFAFDELNRLIQNDVVGGYSTYYRYDSLGNILYKSDVGVYHYGDKAGPHAVTSVTSGMRNGIFEYNANGDQTRGVINGLERTISYTSYSKPKEMKQGNAITNFYYNADRDNFMRVDSANGKTTTTLYLGNYEIASIDDGKKVITEQKYYVGNNALYVKSSEGSDHTYVLLKDNLGSITDIVDENANVVQHFTYAPFGEQRQTKGEAPDNPITHRGFTGHDEVEAFNLVHMGGRIYDPILGRFLTADPTIQALANPQDLNRYSYCLNNPLRFTDPNGFGWFDWVSDIIQAVCDVVKDIVNAVCDIAKELLSNRYAVMALQMIAGATTGGLAYVIIPVIAAASAVACGGNFADALQAAAMTLATMELASFSNAVSTYAQGKIPGGSCWLGKGAINGVVRGAANLAEGKSFKDGFLSGAIDGATSGMIADPAKVKLDQVCIMERAAAASVIGGTEAAATGGNFLDGAETAAFQKLITDEASAHRTISPHNVKGAELAKNMGPNTAVIGERPLDHLGGFMYSDPLLRFLHMDLAHESVFYADQNGKLNAIYYGPNGIGTANNEITRLSEYEFGNIQSISKVTDTDINLPGFEKGTYILAIPPIFTHNCHDSTYQFAKRKGMEY